MLNKFKPRYKTNKKIVDWEPTSDSKSRTMDRDKGKAGKGGNFWVKSLTDGRTSLSSSERKHPASKPCDVVVNEDGDTFHLFRQYKSNPNKRSDFDDPTSWTIYNSASDFCITKINADGERVWEKIYGFPSYMEDGAALYMSPDHDGVTSQLWEDIFSYRIPESFQHSEESTIERFKVNSFIHVEGYLYACAYVNTSTDLGRYNTDFQQIYPDNFVQGIYVVKIDASTGEVVDDSYTHIALTNTQTEQWKRGLTFTSQSLNVPILNYDPYEKKIVVLSKLQLYWQTGGSLGDLHRYSWGTGVCEIDPDTMQATSRYLNYQLQHYINPSQTKNMIAFSPTHTYVVGRTLNAIHPERLDSFGNQLEGQDDTALLKFDKDWNLLDKKQYGYPEKDDQGNYYNFLNNQLGYGEALTQGRGGLQIGQIFYSELKDKIYARNRTSIGDSAITPINQSDHGQAFIDNVSGELDLSFSNTFRITEIEPSDLSVTSVKWPQWKGTEGDNQFPQSYLAVGGLFANARYNYPTSMSLDGKYLYALIVHQGGLAVGSNKDQLLEGSSQHHYFSSPWKQFFGGDNVYNSDILRYNIETGEFDRSWCVAGKQWEKTETGYRETSVGSSQSLVATKDGWVATWSDGQAGSTDYATNINCSITVGAKDSNLTKREAFVGLTDSSRGGLEYTIYEGAMVYQNGNPLSTWEETPGFMTANENWMWDEPADWSDGFPNSEGTDFYTYYNSSQTSSERLDFFDQNFLPIHKIADLIGESHKAYDQDGWVDTVFDVEKTSTTGPLYVATSYKKPFYRGTSEGPSANLINGGDGGLNDQIEVTKPFLTFADVGYNIDVGNQFSGSALLPPLPETDHHVFYSTNPNLGWTRLPTTDSNNGTLELVGSTRSGIVNWDFQGVGDAYPLARTHDTQTVYRYKAIFDWDGTNGNWEDGQIVAVERFGLNSVTGQRNQIKTGHKAFEFLRPIAKDLMYYHGVPLLLQSEEHMWDMGGPGFRTLDTSNLTDMSYMFYRYPAVPASGPTLSSWDTSNVTDMSFMFWSNVQDDQGTRLTIELGWDTSNVTNMESMLPRQSYVDARTWDFSNVVNINNFASEESLILIDGSATVPEIASWGDRQFECRDVKFYLQRCWPGLTNYTILGYEECAYWFPSSYTVMVTNREITDSDLPMYGSANVPSDTKLELVDQYETSTRAARYVYKGIFPWNNGNSNELFWLEDVIQFGGNKLEDGRVAFYSAPITKISAFDNPKFSVSNLTDFDSMFLECFAFNQDLTNWNTSNAVSMSSMFSGCDVFNGDIGSWDVSAVESMDTMFLGCFNFNQDISGWNTQSVISADNQFGQASSFNQDLSEWCVRGLPSEPTDFSTGASSWTLSKPVWGTCPRNEDGLGEEFYHIFIANGNDINFPVANSNEDVRSVYVDDVQLDYVTEVKGKIFNGSTIKAEFDWDNISSWSMDWIDQIVQFGLNSETGNANQIKSGLRAFYFANISNSDAIANLDVSNLTDCTSMFQGNSSNGTLDLSGWDTSNFTDMERIFTSSQCNFVGVENWDVSNVTSMRSFASNATLFNSDISLWDVSSVSDFYQAFRNASSFNQDLSGWCTPLISSTPSGFDTGATAWVLPRPVWGTCPTLTTNFVTNTSTLTWDMLPTNDADNGSISLLSDNGDGTWTFEVDASYDNSVVQKDLSWMIDVLTFKSDVWNEPYAFNGSPATSITALPSGHIAGEDLSYTFVNMPNFNQDISGWDTEATTNMEGTFSGAASFNQELYKWCVSLIATKPTDFDTGATAWLEENKPVWGSCPEPTTVSRVREEGDLIGYNRAYTTAEIEEDGWTRQGAEGDDSSGAMDVPAFLQGVRFLGIEMPALLYNGTNGNLTWIGGSSNGRSGDFVSASTNYDFWLSHFNQDGAIQRQFHKVVNGNEWVVRSDYKLNYAASYGVCVETTFKADGSIKVVYGTVSDRTITIGDNKQGIASRGTGLVEGFGDAANSLGDFVWEYNMP